MMNTKKRIKTVIRFALVTLAVLFVLIVLVILPLFGHIPFIWPEAIKPATVEAVSLTPEEGYGFELPENPPFPVSDEDRDSILKIINGAWRVPYYNDELKPTYDSLYRIYLTIDIKLHEEEKTYKLLFYNHKDYSLIHGESEYKLALVREQAGKSKMWQLPYEACYKLKDWYNNWYMEKFE